MSESQTRQRVENLKSPVSSFQSLVGARIDMLTRDIEAQCEHFKSETDIRIVMQETEIIRLASVLTLSAYYHINRAYFHASSGLIAIVVAIVEIVVWAYTSIKWLVNTRVAQILIGIHRILYTIWGDYKKEVDKHLKNVSDYAQSIGMGVDGLINLFSAAQGAVGLYAGIRGKDYEGFRGDLYESFNKNTARVKYYLQLLAEDPSAFFTKFFLDEQGHQYNEAKEWWGNTLDTIEAAVDMVDKAAEQIASIGEELLKFEASLPDLIREHIPSWITHGLRDMNDYIYYNVKPALAKVDNKLSEVNAVLDSYRDNAADLVDKLAHPGEVLLGVDDLPDYARDAQLAMIDDVTSREFETAATAERLAMSGDLEDFDIINAALTAPTPEPVFLSIEASARHEATGIVLEPHETWFVGDY
ncbi:hypothetical protein ES707_06695 [subsurface metagenome]